MSNSDIIAIASVVIAGLAFFTTVWQTWVGRQHSRLSVKPLLCWGTSRHVGQASLEISATLSNKGLGPALVKERYFQLDGKHFALPQGSELSEIEALVEQIFPKDWERHIVSQSIPGVSGAIFQGTEITVVRILFKPRTGGFLAEIERIMDRVDFVVVYEDLYQNRHVFRT